MVHVLLAAGVFDDAGGRRSGYMEKLSNALTSYSAANFGGTLFEINNGGNFSHLQQLLERINEYNVVLWFADVPNDKPKLVEQIKVRAPKTLLVTSKNNLDGQYEKIELIARALKVKANLFLEFTRDDNRFLATLLDPLGNSYFSEEASVDKVADGLLSRVRRLLSFHRVRSESIGPPIDIPNPVRFFEVARNHAETFHRLIHAVHQDRFLGNLSFRCESGFPAFRDEDTLYVSRRNIDKRQIGPDGFVAVDLNYKPEWGEAIGYFGDVKPSVDTPILARLYRKFPKVRYSLHSHVYVSEYVTEGLPWHNIPVTSEPIPCGSIEEADEIERMKLPPYNFAINLKGHGSLIMARDVAFLEHIKFAARPFPEPCEDGTNGTLMAQMAHK